LELQPIFGDLDGRDRRADQLDAVLRQRSRVGEIDGEIERRLPADSRQQRIRPLALDDHADDFRRERLDIGAIRQLRVGHDRGRWRSPSTVPSYRFWCVTSTSSGSEAGSTANPWFCDVISILPDASCFTG